MGRIIVKPGPPAAPNIVCVGDSITLGQNTADPGGTTSYPYYLAQDLGYSYGLVAGKRVINRGVSSLGSRDLPDVDYLLRPGQPNHIILMIGVNDIVSNFDLAEIEGNVFPWISARVASGWIVTVKTLTVIGPATTGQNIVSAQWSAAIRSVFARVIEHATDPNIGHDATTPSAYITGDQTHPTALGNQLQASQCAAFMTTHMSGATIPYVDTKYGLPITSDLTGWWRDWWSVSPTDLSVNNDHGLIDQHDFQNYLGQNGYTFSSPPHLKCEKVAGDLNGYPTIHFPGNAVDNSAYFISALECTQFFTASSCLAQIVFKAQSIETNAGSLDFNETLFTTGENTFGLALRNTGTGYKIYAYIYDDTLALKTTAQLDVTLNTWYVASVRLTAGKLGLQLGSGDIWHEVSCGTINALDGLLRVGVSWDLNHPFHGWMADKILRNAYSDGALAAGYAYLHARYGL